MAAQGGGTGDLDRGSAHGGRQPEGKEGKEARQREHDTDKVEGVKKKDGAKGKECGRARRQMLKWKGRNACAL